MKLSSREFGIIRQKVVSSQISISTLADDLFDHLVCDVEQKLEDGANFDDALFSALEELAPHGLDKLEKDTILLIKSNKFVPMKKLIYTIGLISSLMMVTGLIMNITLGMRILNEDGLYILGTDLASGGLGTFGFMIFAWLFLPATILAKPWSNLSVERKTQLAFGTLSAAVTATAILFKMLHLPGADGLFLIAGGVFAIIFLPALFLGMYRRSLA